MKATSAKSWTCLLRNNISLTNPFVIIYMMYVYFSQEDFSLDFNKVNFDAMIPDWFKTIVSTGNDLIWTQFPIGLLLLAGLFFSLSSRFVQLRWLREMFRVIRRNTRHLMMDRKGFPHSRHLPSVRRVVSAQVILPGWQQRLCSVVPVLSSGCG